MKQIPLTQGKFSIVDDEAFDKLNEFRWHLNAHGYAQRNVGSSTGTKRSIVLMHRIVVGASTGEEVDHINMDRIDNRISNLRVATKQQNLFNRSKNRNNTSGHKGVVWHKAACKWMATINVMYKQIYLGLFDDINEAALAYQTAAKKYHGEFARW